MILQQRWVVRLIALLILYVLVIHVIPQNTSQPEPNNNVVRPLVNPVQLMYQTKEQAAIDGWTSAGLQQVGEARLKLGDVAGAIAAWEAAEIASRELAQGYITLERWPEAINALQQIVAADSDDNWARDHLTRLLMVADLTYAEEHLRVLARIPEYGEMSADLLVILRDETDPSRIAMRSGLLYMNKGMWPQAEYAFRGAQVDHPEAQALLALVCSKQGKQAERDMQEAIDRAGNQHAIRYVQGLYLRERLDYTGSLVALTQAVSLNPLNPAYYAELSNTNRLLFNYENAERWLQMAVAVSDNALPFQQRLAQFYAEEGYRLSPDRLGALQGSQDFLPLDPEIMAQFGWALQTMGDSDGAAAQIEAALALAPDDPSALYYKARLLAATGDLQQAVTLMEQVAGAVSDYANIAQQQIDEWTVGLP